MSQATMEWNSPRSVKAAARDFVKPAYEHYKTLEGVTLSIASTGVRAFTQPCSNSREEGRSALQSDAPVKSGSGHWSCIGFEDRFLQARCSCHIKLCLGI